MRLYRGNTQQGERTNSVNMAIKVGAYLEEKGVVIVKGMRLDTDTEVFVALTNRGEQASNAKRPSLDKFRDKKDNLGVEIGGVIGFDRCYPNDQVKDGFYAGWPTFMAGNGSAEQMKRLKANRDTTLQIRSQPATGRLFGTLSVWQKDNITDLNTLDNLEAATAKWLNDVTAKIPNAHGAAIMRARNANDEVVAYTFLYARYDKEKGVYEDGDKAVTNFKTSRSYEGFKNEAAAGGAVKWDIVPAVNLDIAPRSLEDGANAFRATEKSFLRDGDLIAKSTTFVMDPNHKFVIKVMVHDPFGDSGIDPVLLTKPVKNEEGKLVVRPLTYSAAFKASLSGVEAPAQNGGQQEPAASTPAETGPSIEV